MNLRGQWRNLIDVNMRAPYFYKEIKFFNFFGNFKLFVWKENIFKSSFGDQLNQP
jgi:hypothetical protein